MTKLIFYLFIFRILSYTNPITIKAITDSDTEPDVPIIWPSAYA